MQLTANTIYFFVSYAVAFLVFALIAKWYLWPSIKDRALKPALTPLLLYSCLRINGLMFLMPGLVSPELPSSFATPTAYGDLIAVLLALVALVLVRLESALSVPVLWLFNIVGLLDLTYGNVSSLKDQINPAQWGTAYYLVVLNVPAMIVVHVLMIAYLLRHRAAK
jgi:hypothetical protein